MPNGCRQIARAASVRPSDANSRAFTAALDAAASQRTASSVGRAGEMACILSAPGDRPSRRSDTSEGGAARLTTVHLVLAALEQPEATVALTSDADLSAVRAALLDAWSVDPGEILVEPLVWNGGASLECILPWGEPERCRIAWVDGECVLLSHDDDEETLIAMGVPACPCFVIRGCAQTGMNAWLLLPDLLGASDDGAPMMPFQEVRDSVEGLASALRGSGDGTQHPLRLSPHIQTIAAHYLLAVPGDLRRRIGMSMARPLLAAWPECKGELTDAVAASLRSLFHQHGWVLGAHAEIRFTERSLPLVESVERAETLLLQVSPALPFVLASGLGPAIMRELRSASLGGRR